MAYQPTDWEHGDIITGGKLNKIEKELTHVSDNATYGFGGAQLSSDGLTPLSYINAGDPMPANPQKGDTVFLKDGNDFLIYSYNGEDWVLKVDPDLSNRIEETIKTASDNTDKAIADNNTQINETINQVAKEQADLAVKDGDFNNKAQAMADKALQDAKDNTATVAKSTLDTANQNIADAKKSVTDDIAQEASDRASAVSALDTKAQGYADTAKKNAIDVATSADGVINKKIDDTASSITSTVSQNKKDAEGKITTAQSTATQALNGLSSKVDTATYNAKTGQLSTDVTNVTQTANKAQTDIASIKQTDTSQDARMTTIEADANGTKTTVNNLQTIQGQQSGSISALQQRADGFDATVTKVNSLAVGGRNLIIGSRQINWNTGLNTATTMAKVDFDSTTKTWHITSPKGGSNNCGIYFGMAANSSKAIAKGEKWAFSFDVKGTGTHSQFGIEGSTSFSKYAGEVSSDWIRVSSTGVSNGSNIIIIYFSSMNTAVDVYVKLPKLETGNIATDWTPAPEDVDSATAKAQLTADQATTALNNYKTDADGRITKAQSDITQTAKDVTTKVSQSDYNAKTGDLDTRVTKAQTTADGAVTTVGAYKNSNDNRVKATETSIAQNTKDITLRATTADLNSAKTDYNSKVSQVQVNVDSITSSMSNNSGNGIRYIRFRGEGNTDNQGTHFGNISVFSSNGTDLIVGKTATTVGNPTTSGNGLTAATDGKYNTSYIGLEYNPSNHEQYIQFDLGTVYYNVDHVEIGMWTTTRTYYSVLAQVSYDGTIWNTIYKGNIDKTYLVGNSTTGQVVGTTIAIGNSNAQISAQQITINGITDTVSKQGTNIDSVTKRVQTAEGTLSTATDNISGLQTKQTTTANQVTQEITDRTKGDANTLQSSKDFTTSSITSYDKGVQTQLTQTANGILAQVESTNMVVNSEFDPLNGTFYRLTNGGSTGSQLAEAWSATKATGFADWSVVNGSRIVSYAVGTWYTSSLVTASAGKVFSASIVAGRAPAPTVSTALDYRIGFWDSSRKLLTTASAGNIIDGTAYKGIQKYVVENKTAPANTAFVSVIIAHSSANATDYICRPSLNVGAKASPYTPTYGTSSSSTVLSLFKDNWSIGITDNISKITSGIVGNASQMSLISKNVTIDAPSTQIKGTAWIQSAMIANGAIGTAQIGDATITNAKIATLDVAKLTGDTSTFIQSNWNGIFGSTQITDTGMTVTSKSPKADLSIRSVFDANGLTMYTPKGTTAIRDGETAYISSSNEDIGMMGTVKWAPHPNVDYLMIGLHGWHTTTPGDSSYDQNSDNSNVVYGGDGLGFGISNANGGYDMLMTWDSPLVAGYQGRMSGWHVEDVFTTHSMSYAAGGLKVSSQYAEGERSLHTQGIDINSNSKWFGFVDGSGKVGFGTDQTQDVIVLIKGKSYSMYTMLNKLGMLK